jgi:hypothetical protein
VGISVKYFIELYNKLGPCNIPLIFIFIPLPPFLVFKIQIENNIINFYQLISNAMQIKTMLHLSDPTLEILSIKFIDVNSGNMGVMLKGVGLNDHRMGGVDTI